MITAVDTEHNLGNNIITVLALQEILKKVIKYIKLLAYLDVYVAMISLHHSIWCAADALWL